MLLLDGVYLTARAAYHAAVFEAVQGAPLQLRAAPALAVYLLLAAAVALFARASTLPAAAARGAALGACIYGVYDLTNYATLARYPLHMVVGDTLWGTALLGVAAAAAHLATRPRKS